MNINHTMIYTVSFSTSFMAGNCVPDTHKYVLSGKDVSFCSNYSGKTIKEVAYNCPANKIHLN